MIEIFLSFSQKDYLTAILIFFGAIIYSSVGHGGASSYIAIMSLLGTPTNFIKPIGLTLNVIVSSVASFRFIQNKFFNLKVFLPIIAASVPAAFLGGYINLTDVFYRPLLGFVLFIAGLQLIFNFVQNAPTQLKKVNLLYAFIAGASIGFISGLTGTGGGIFLSPLIVLFGWTSVRAASGTAAAFILLNSIAGLLGNLSSIQSLPPTIFLYSIAVILGVTIGTQLGIKHFDASGIRKVLGVVLIIAAWKFILT